MEYLFQQNFFTKVQNENEASIKESFQMAHLLASAFTMMSYLNHICLQQLKKCF